MYLALLLLDYSSIALSWRCCDLFIWFRSNMSVMLVPSLNSLPVWYSLVAYVCIAIRDQDRALLFGKRRAMMIVVLLKVPNNILLSSSSDYLDKSPCAVSSTLIFIVTNWDVFLVLARADVVKELIEGMVETYPHLTYLDGIPEVKAIMLIMLSVVIIFPISTS